MRENGMVLCSHNQTTLKERGREGVSVGRSGEVERGEATTRASSPQFRALPKDPAWRTMRPRKLGAMYCEEKADFSSYQGSGGSSVTLAMVYVMLTFCAFLPCSSATTTVSWPSCARPINRSPTGWNRSRAASEAAAAAAEASRVCRHRRDIIRRRRRHRRATTTVRMRFRSWGSWSSCRRPTRTTARWPPRPRGPRPSSAAGTAAAGGAATRMNRMDVEHGRSNHLNSISGNALKLRRCRRRTRRTSRPTLTTAR